MSINLNGLFEIARRPLLDSTSADGAKDAGNADFARLLEQQANPANTAAELGMQGAALVNMAQVRMLQGLFADEEADGAAALLPDFETLQPLSLLSSHQGQIIDKYYRVEPSAPSLAEATPQQRDRIDSLISQVARKLNLSEDLIHSVVRTESAYDPQAVSPVGAQGLMQLMPQTAAELGVEDSFNPLDNLMGGGRYLKQLLNKYDGDLDHALAAYNWGQGNVDRRGLDQMPQETRDYLVRVKNLLAERQG